MSIDPPLVLALCRPGPFRLICGFFGPVVFEMNGMSLVPQNREATFTLGGSTCLVLLAVTAGAVLRHGVSCVIPSVVPTVLARRVLLVLLALADRTAFLIDVHRMFLPGSLQ